MISCRKRERLLESNMEENRGNPAVTYHALGGKCKEPRLLPGSSKKNTNMRYIGGDTVLETGCKQYS